VVVGKTSWKNNMSDLDGVEFCTYCLEERGDKRSCCHENHWVEYKDLDEETQEYLKESK
jgi:hypothetical protein